MTESTFQEFWKLPAWGKKHKPAQRQKRIRSAGFIISPSNISLSPLSPICSLSQTGILTKNRTLKTTNIY